MHFTGTCDISVCVFYECSGNGSPDPAPKNPGGESCKDKMSSCSGWKDYCKGQYEDYMNKNCPKTCNACPSAPLVPTQSSCEVSKTFRKVNGDHILSLTANGE